MTAADFVKRMKEQGRTVTLKNGFVTISPTINFSFSDMQEMIRLNKNNELADYIEKEQAND